MAVLAGILAFGLAAGVLYQAVGARRSARRFTAPGELVDIGGQRLHVVHAGAGRPTVLLEAGVASSTLSWTRVMPSVAAFTHACAYDRAGLGWSDRSQTPRTVDRIVADLHGVLAHAAGPGPVVLAGHSFGAFLVLVYAARYPGHVAGLVLVDPPTDWQDPGPQRVRLLRRGIRASRLGGALAHIGVVRACLSLLTGGAPGVPRHAVRALGPRAVRTLEHLVGEVRKLPPEVHPLVQTLWSDPKCFRGMAEHLGVLGALGRSAGRIASLGNVPIAVVSAGDQPPDVIAQHRALSQLSSQGRHIVAANSGHWVQLDEPDLVVSTIRDIVARN